MRKSLKIGIAIVGAIVMGGTFAACSSVTPQRDQQLEDSQAQFDNRTPPQVTGDAEYQNYMNAQENVYDDPSTIIWCTATWSNAQAPLFTVPIAGKLTSSSVSYYPNESAHGDSSAPYLLENQSVDGMYHGTPPAYRYGFTPGGQYVDFSNMEVFCTTQLTEFQKATLQTATVAPEDTLTKQAEDKLKNGDPQGAQALLDSIGAK